MKDGGRRGGRTKEAKDGERRARRTKQTENGEFDGVQITKGTTDEGNEGRRIQMDERKRANCDE